MRRHSKVKNDQKTLSSQHEQYTYVCTIYQALNYYNSQDVKHIMKGGFQRSAINTKVQK